jgi:hypothetical protein
VNLFITSDDLGECARFLDDRRLIKSILENTQLLSTAVNVYGGKGCYRTTHVNHPISVWTRKTRGNFKYVLDFTYKLIEEYALRFSKIHACYSLLPDLAAQAELIPDGQRSELCNCARNTKLGVDFSHEKDVCVAYQMYLNYKWKLDGSKARSRFIGRFE